MILWWIESSKEQHLFEIEITQPNIWMVLYQAKTVFNIGNNKCLLSIKSAY